MDLFKGGGEFLVGDLLAVDADAFGGLQQVGGGIEAGAEAGCAESALEEGAGGALAIGAGDVDEAEPLFRGAESGQEAGDAVQAQLDGLVFVAERVEEAD